MEESRAALLAEGDLLWTWNWIVRILSVLQRKQWLPGTINQCGFNFCRFQQNVMARHTLMLEKGNFRSETVLHRILGRIVYDKMSVFLKIYKIFTVYDLFWSADFSGNRPDYRYANTNHLRLRCIRYNATPLIARFCQELCVQNYYRCNADRAQFPSCTEIEGE